MDSEIARTRCSNRKVTPSNNHRCKNKNQQQIAEIFNEIHILIIVPTRTAVKEGSWVGPSPLFFVIRTAPGSFGKWAPVLLNASKRGDNSLNATDFVLQQQDPDYREHRRNLQDQSK